MAAAVRDRLVSAEEAAQIKSDIVAYFREELVKLRTKQELRRDAQGKFQQAVFDIYEKHIGMERTAGGRAHGIQNPFNQAECGETSSCCS